MDIIEKKDYYATLELLESGRLIDRKALTDLCLVLCRSCTPYLGHHGKVERALAAFVEVA